MEKNIILLLVIKTVFILNIFFALSKSIILRKQLFHDEKYQDINDSFNKAKDFLDKCLRGILIRNRIINSSKNPIASVIIPIFNTEKTIERAIRSVQNQNIENLEIILVNDFSIDNTSLVIEDLKKIDTRIKIINNKKNKGTLYSRCIGVLSAIGEYIFHLDSDDLFLDKDIISTMINITLIGNFDFISFRAINIFPSKNILNSTIKDNMMANNNPIQILFQPELGLYPLRPSNKLGDYEVNDNYVWNKCIKSKVYRKVLNKITKSKFSRYMRYEEDRLIVYVLFNEARLMKYVGKYGILIIKGKGSITRRKFKKKKEYFLSILYFVDIIIDFSKKSFENRKVLIYIMTYLLKMLKFNHFSKLKEYDKKLFISCINRIIYNEYVSKADKVKMIDWTLSLIYKKKLNIYK